MRNALGTGLALATLALMGAMPGAAQVPDGFCWTPGQAADCRAHIVTESGFPVHVEDDAPRFGLDWKVGVMFNVRPRHAIGGAVTLVGAERDFSYSGLELRYRRWAASGLAGEAALGGSWMRPAESWTGSPYFRSHLRIGVWVNEFVGGFLAGTSGDGATNVTGGPQIGSWPGFALGAALSALFVALL